MTPCPMSLEPDRRRFYRHVAGAIGKCPKHRIVDHRAGRAVVEQESDFARRKTCVDRKCDRAEPRRREDRFEIGRVVAEQDRDPVAGDDPAVPERIRELGDAAVERRVVETAMCVGHRCV